MDPFNFLNFYVPTSIVFMVTFFLTLALLKPYPHGFKTALQILLAFLAISFLEAVSFIAPSHTANTVINIISGMVFFIMMFMCIAYRVSKISVSILGCWLISLFSGNSVLSIFTICWLFFFLHDEFWKGTAIAIGYIGLAIGSIGLSMGYIGPATSTNAGFLLGCWFFLGLCRFCIRRRYFFYKRWNNLCHSS